AGAPLPATDPRASMVTVAADMVVTSRVRGRQHRAAAQESLQSASILALPSSGRAIADIGRSSKSP
ncbi:MAG: hypothetical protein ACT6RL_22195, partial [Neoaquamicrobium sediminum]|uniref:hypothetical protein n=1 Tax=Neoaquamicrobium sediminum TaxID=1849104 RepID=UPI0040379638